MNVFLKPGTDSAGKPFIVRDPESGKILDVNGENKPQSAFWLHRIRDKDVVIATPDAAPKPAADKAKAATVTSV